MIGWFMFSGKKGTQGSMFKMQYYRPEFNTISQIHTVCTQLRKYTRGKGKTAPEKYNFAPDITRRWATNAPIISSNNYDNLIAFYLCSLLCVSYLYVGTHQQIYKSNFE